MQIILRTMRERRGLSQIELSRRSGIPQAMISEIENGVSKSPQISTMYKLAQGLRCTVDDLIIEDNASHDRPA